MECQTYGTMCRFCDHLKGSPEPHTVIDCKYRKSFYCPTCASYGHNSNSCPNKVAWALRKGIPPPPQGNLLLLVEDSEEAIKKKLKQYCLPYHGSKQQNRSLLRDLCNCLSPPRLLLFTKPK